MGVRRATRGGGDDLLECMAYITQLAGTPRMIEALRSGLPHDGGPLTPELFVRAAQHNGFRALIVERKLAKIMQESSRRDQEPCTGRKANRPVLVQGGGYSCLI